MKKILVSFLFVLLGVLAVQADTLDPAYRKNFGEGTIVATNNGYPSVTACNPADYNYQNGAFHVKIGTPICFRVILPAGKTWKNYQDKVLKEKGDNLKYKEKDIFYWRIWSDRDENGEKLDEKKFPWPVKTGEVPSWSEAGWFSGSWGSETANWETVGINADMFNESVNQIVFTAQPGQKFYITVATGYSYMTPGGQMENKWNDLLKRFEPVESTGELGFVTSDIICAGTFVVDGTVE